jgi:hypothetical protein
MYTENTGKARKVKYLGKFKTKIGNILGSFSGTQIGSLGQTSFNYISGPLSIFCQDV